MIRAQNADALKMIRERYDDKAELEKSGFRAYWVTLSGDGQVISGKAPEDWSHNEPHYENG